MEITRVGIDLAKSVFQVQAVDQHGKVALKKQPWFGTCSTTQHRPLSRLRNSMQ